MASSLHPDLSTTTPEEVVDLVGAASVAAGPWAATSRADRARALGAVADALDAEADPLVGLARTETQLPAVRLRGELKRTTFQLRLFGEVLTEGSYLDVRIDHADPDWPMGAPRPDLRSRLEPLGPVVVFAASNFPFAFSVAGGDTASALAAGCPVLLKVHPGHPQLSVATGQVVTEALRAAGAPDGVFALLVGDEAGRAALVDLRVKGGAFTGSLTGGRALFDLATGRPDPVPFFGELGSVNPVFVTRTADARRAATIADGFLGSVTMGAGQFCTKPGVLLVPEGSTIPGELAAAQPPAAAPMLNDRIRDGYLATLDDLRRHADVSLLAEAENDQTADDAPGLTLLQTDVAALLADLNGMFRECFGPTGLVVTYRDDADLLALAEAIDGQLTATIQGEEGDEVVPELLRRLARRAGRVLWNAWPTGVSVTHAQSHGGPYPATTAPASTSVGTAAIGRFLRPVAYQGFPQSLLPDELTDRPRADLPRRVDGQV